MVKVERVPHPLPDNYIKVEGTACPKCHKTDKMYHIVPFDYKHYCDRCSIECVPY